MIVPFFNHHFCAMDFVHHTLVWIEKNHQYEVSIDTLFTIARPD